MLALALVCPGHQVYLLYFLNSLSSKGGWYRADATQPALPYVTCGWVTEDVRLACVMIFPSLGQLSAILQVLCFVVCCEMCHSGFQASSARVMTCVRFENAWWAFLTKSSGNLLNVDALISAWRQKFLKLPVQWLPNTGSAHAAFAETLWDPGASRIYLLTNIKEPNYLKIPSCSPQVHW